MGAVPFRPREDRRVFGPFQSEKRRSSTREQISVFIVTSSLRGESPTGES